MNTRVAILGHFDATRPSRAMLGPALEHSASALGIEIEYSWVASSQTNESITDKFDAIFVSPGDPTEDVQGILKAIQAARQNQTPCLGTCGGFQRVVTEYVLNELDFKNLENEEVTPDATYPFFSQLSCSLVGQDAEVQLIPDSLAARIYGSDRTVESFFCGYGINSMYLKRLQSAALKVSAYDSSGEARIVELAEHPFFMGTLFVPQVRSTASQPHPIITELLRATCNDTKPIPVSM